MQIMIEISEEVYKDIIKNGFIYDEDGEEISHAIINGTPLPEHHGRLIDINVLKNNIHYVPLAPILQGDYVTYRSVIFADVLDMLPTIVEGE